MAQSKPPLLHYPWQAGKSHRIAHPHSTRLGSLACLDTLGTLGTLGTLVPQISPASRTDCVGSVCNLSNLHAAGSARSMIPASLRLWHALSLSAPATACQAPSTEGACPRLTSSQRLDSAWGTFDYHRRCARCTQHAPTHPRGAESDGLVDLQIKPRQTQITFVWWPIPYQSPSATVAGLPQAQWFRAGKAPLWHEERQPVPSLRIIPLCPTMPIEIPSSVG